jgi:hypothetical protein
MERARPHLQADPIYRAQPAEALAQITSFQDDVV